MELADNEDTCSDHDSEDESISEAELLLLKERVNWFHETYPLCFGPPLGPNATGDEILVVTANVMEAILTHSLENYTGRIVSVVPIQD